MLKNKGFTIMMLWFVTVLIILIIGLTYDYKRMERLDNAILEEEKQNICLNEYKLTSIRNLPVECIKYFN